MDVAGRKDKQKSKETANRADKVKQKSAQHEMKQRQRAEIYALNKVMTELEQEQFKTFCQKMEPQGNNG
ncbi:small vasohibin-binding protein [Protopterus annectens]|uniref:small vasohibin-binding protein n=1 Tax=Protopterus annectens TaxID=7888 RepID=UPI001CFBA269|nr:small vasohibin-binding protein [Protopterus annectens]XP_043918793.1 small vasohibin-binding protein [Protopterus annectens]XP_043918794.1 small vasohibin-binding protein [Protopterus annectens]XP_043918795.1 small vasohibin-binding protein [Protopterus annectens]